MAVLQQEQNAGQIGQEIGQESLYGYLPKFNNFLRDVPFAPRPEFNLVGRLLPTFSPVYDYNHRPPQMETELISCYDDRGTTKFVKITDRFYDEQGKPRWVVVEMSGHRPQRHGEVSMDSLKIREVTAPQGNDVLDSISWDPGHGWKLTGLTQRAHGRERQGQSLTRGSLDVVSKGVDALSHTNTHYKLF